MRYLFRLIIFTAMLTSLPLVLSAQESASRNNPDTLFDDLTKHGEHTDYFMIYGGYHNHLYGYTNRRYLGSDKSDYIITDSEQGGIEFCKSDLTFIYKDLVDARFGMNIAYYRFGKIGTRNLYAVPGHDIPAETVPTSNASRSKYYLKPGFFVGYGMRWIGIDIGFTLNLKYYNEEHRQELLPGSTPAAPLFVTVKGRGLLLDKSGWRPNFYFRMGPENMPHFVFSVFRENYDPVYGYCQMYLVFPVSQYFGMNVGGYLAPCQSMFFEPVVKMWGISLGLRCGTMLNYHDDNLERVGVKDTLFYMVSASYAWK